MAQALRQLAKIIRQKNGQALASERQAVGKVKMEQQRILVGYETLAAAAVAEILKSLSLQIKQERNGLGDDDSA